MREWAVQPRLYSDQLAAVHITRPNDRAIAALSEQARLAHLVLANEQRGRRQTEHADAAARWGWTPLALAAGDRPEQQLAKTQVCQGEEHLDTKLRKKTEIGGLRRYHLCCAHEGPVRLAPSFKAAKLPTFWSGARWPVPVRFRPQQASPPV